MTILGKIVKIMSHDSCEGWIREIQEIHPYDFFSKWQQFSKVSRNSAYLWTWALLILESEANLVQSGDERPRFLWKSAKVFYGFYKCGDTFTLVKCAKCIGGMKLL